MNKDANFKKEAAVTKAMGAKRRKTRTFKDIVFSTLIHAELLLVLAAVLFPIVWIAGTSLSPTSSVTATSLIPDQPTFKNFTELFSKTKFVLWYKNTLIIALLSMVCTVLVHSFTAFIFARFKFKGQKQALFTIMLFQMFPSFLGLTALYVICLNFGLLNNIYTLVVIYVAGGIPGNIWLVRGYMLNIPKTLDEAAFIDGASKITMFFRIILPLATPIIAFMAVTSFMGPWFDYILPRMLLSSNDKHTIALGLFSLVDPNSPNYNFPRFAAASLLIAVPIATFQFVFQKYLVTGLMAGANKGE